MFLMFSCKIGFNTEGPEPTVGHSLGVWGSQKMKLE